MIDQYGLKDNEYKFILSKVFNQPISIKGNSVYNVNGNLIYSEDSLGYWIKKEYDTNGNKIYSETSTGFWIKYGYDINGNLIYKEDSDGNIIDNRR
jgi:YD repeat-containing protein